MSVRGCGIVYHLRVSAARRNQDQTGLAVYGGGFSLSSFVGRTTAEYIDTDRRPVELVELSWQRYRDGKTIPMVELKRKAERCLI